jgi:O-antigen ligase
LGLVLLVVLNRHAWKRILVAVTALVVIGVAGSAFVPVIRDRIAASLLSFGIGSSASSGVPHDDVSTFVSAWERLTTLPRANIDALGNVHSPLAYLTGGGYGMGSTALVPPGDSIAPMSHNQFAEMFTVFGAVGGGAQLVILTLIGYLLWRRLRSSREPILLAIFFAYILFLLNSVFANGTLYQPASASILFIAMFAATSSLFDEKLAPGQSSLRVNRSLRALAGLSRLIPAPSRDAADVVSTSSTDVVDA